MALSKGFSKISGTTEYSGSQSDLPTLLIVDDEHEITKSLSDQFSRSYHILTAFSADEALSVLRKKRVSVIMADQRMPGKTGVELLAEALKIDPDAVRILLTGYADIEAVIQSVNEGKIYFYVTKPWRMDEMDTIIARAMEHNKLLKANRRLVEELRLANAELEERVKIRTAELEQRARELEEANRKIEELAYLDPLTGVANRRSLEKIFQREVERGARLGLSLTAIMLDIDHFKSVNDRFGHAIGDLVLRSIAHTLSAQARPYDLVARYGGEEFMILMPGVSLEQGKFAAERFRIQVEGMRVNALAEPVTASFGVACLLPGHPPEFLFDLADKALYRAKQNGRNRVAVADETET